MVFIRLVQIYLSTDSLVFPKDANIFAVIHGAVSQFLMGQQWRLFVLLKHKILRKKVQASTGFELRSSQ